MTDVRKEKRRARSAVKKEYLLLVMVCLYSIVGGGLFRTSAASLELMSETGFLIGFEETKEERAMLLEIGQKLISGRLEEAHETAVRAKEAEKNEENRIGSFAFRKRDTALGRFISDVETGAFFTEAAMIVNRIFRLPYLSLVLTAILFLSVFGAVWLLILRPGDVVMARAAIRAVSPDHAKEQAAFNSKTWWNAALSMALMKIDHFVWSLTIVGGFVIYYAHFLAPFLVAEDPRISPKEALHLSKKMMKGHKRELFCLQLRFLPWFLLAFATLGLSDVFYGAPYRASFYARFYAAVREEREQNIALKETAERN